MSDIAIAVRLMEAADRAALAALMTRMQAHYAVPCPAEESILGQLAALPPGVEIVVAHSGGSLVGFAAAGAVYPGPGLTSGFFLKELYVDAAARGAGVGHALMRAMAALALARGHKRLDWTADAGDAALLRFYESLGAEPQPKKLFFRLTGEALTEAARSSPVLTPSAAPPPAAGLAQAPPRTRGGA